MAFTFKKTLEGVKVCPFHAPSFAPLTSHARTLQIGSSVFDQPGYEKVAGLVEKPKSKGVKLVLPVDYVTADKFEKNVLTGAATDESGISDGWLGRDVGPMSSELYRKAVAEAKTIHWNGYVEPFLFSIYSRQTHIVYLQRCVYTDE